MCCVISIVKHPARHPGFAWVPVLLNVFTRFFQRKPGGRAAKIGCRGRASAPVICFFLFTAPTLAAEPPFPQDQAGFEDALSLPVPILEIKAPGIKGYDCVTADPPRAAVLFDFDSAALLPAYHPVLEALADALNGRLAGTDFTLEGHTDNVGTDAYNMALSTRRAQAVWNYLIARGVPGQRLSVTGLGEAKPLADNRDEAGRARNRRVEIVRVSSACD